MNDEEGCVEHVFDRVVDKNTGRVLAIDPPLKISSRPLHCHDDRHLIESVEDTEFSIYVIAETQEEFCEEVAADLFYLYDEYANEPDQNLTNDAVALKARINRRLKLQGAT